MHTRLSSLFVRVSLSALLATAACACATEGALGKASFQYAGSLSSPSDAPVAVGATTSVTVTSASPVSSATSSDPSVLKVGAVTPGASGTYAISITGMKPGTVTLTARDASGKEIDQTTVGVAAPASISLTETSGATILTGQTFSFLASALGPGGVSLEGEGAVHVSYEGALTAGTKGSGGLCLGECEYVKADAPGDGQIVLTAPPVTTTLSLHAVAPSSIDALTLAKSSLALTVGQTAAVRYDLLAGGTLVHGAGASCASADPSVAVVDVDLFGVELSGPSTGALLVTGAAAGTTRITCSMNGVQQVLALSVK